MAVLVTSVGVTAQALKDVQSADAPLVLKAQGSFFVGGEKSEQTRVELGDLGPEGHIAVNQMYVRYMVPQGGEGNVSVVMVHGATLTGKSWETTPDGRMGWDEYFVRKGHPVYVPDQVGRGRSGFNQAVFNDVRAGTVPAANLPRLLRFSDEVVWPNFRFGSKPGAPYADSQFPVTAVDELSKQGVPDVSFGGVPTPNPTLKALSDLATQLNGAVLMGHSQSGSFPLAAALLNPTVAKGLVLVEPGRCPANYTDEQIKTLAALPILVVFGDHRDTPTGIGTLPSWQISFDSCQALIGRLKAAGGQAQMLNPPDRGIRGNSHMIMQDRNNLQIADLILQWINERVSKRVERNPEDVDAAPYRCSLRAREGRGGAAMTKRFTLAIAIFLSVAVVHATDWPQWQGPDRTRISKETGLLKEWPTGGPRLIWTANNLGSGYGSMAVAGDRVFLQGARGPDSVVIALNRADGKEVWAKAVGPINTRMFTNHGRRTARHADGRRRSPVRAHRERRPGVSEDRWFGGLAIEHPQGIRRFAAAMDDQRVAARRRTARRGVSRWSWRRDGEVGQDDGQDGVGSKGAHRHRRLFLDHRRRRAGGAHVHDVH